MFKYIRQICIFTAFIGVTIVYGQEDIESLKHKLVGIDNPSDKVDILLKIAYKYIYVNIDSANLYANKAKISLMDNPSLSHSANYYKIKGLLLSKELNNELAISHFRTSYGLYDEMDNLAWAHLALE